MPTINCRSLPRPSPRPPRFTARLDPTTGLYLALTNPSIDRYGANSDARNILALVYSKDLLSWRVAATLLVPNDGLPWDDSLWRTAYQYPGALRCALCALLAALCCRFGVAVMLLAAEHSCLAGGAERLVAFPTQCNSKATVGSCLGNA